MHSGVIEHMCINPDGPLCYCGNHGCLETYCSANALVHSTGLAAKEFFPLLMLTSHVFPTQTKTRHQSHAVNDGANCLCTLKKRQDFGSGF